MVIIDRVDTRDIQVVTAGAELLVNSISIAVAYGYSDDSVIGRETLLCDDTVKASGILAGVKIVKNIISSAFLLHSRSDGCPIFQVT